MAKVAFTAPRVAGFKCPPDKQQAFLWDATAPGLGLRTTPAGKPSYVFQGLYQGKTIRITIGSPAAWTIPNAQAKARELQCLIDEGHDPREVRREAQAAQEQKRAAEAAAAEQTRKDAAAAALFASTRTVKMDGKNMARRERRAHAKGESMALGEVVEASATGHITEPRSHHACACQAAGIDGLTLHGLRRSFKSLTEWLEIAAGVVAQIMGHKPSATGEKHYTVRPLDLLRVHHERIEAWMLEQAGVPFEMSAVSATLRAIA